MAAYTNLDIKVQTLNYNIFMEDITLLASDGERMLGYLERTHADMGNMQTPHRKTSDWVQSQGVLTVRQQCYPLSSIQFKFEQK